MTASAIEKTGKLSMFGLIVGPIVAVLILLVGAPDQMTGDSHLTDAWITLALLVLMAIWWVTEAVPIPITSLLPLIVLPLFGVGSMSVVAAPYMHPIVVLLMGGFIFAKAIEYWGLHERIALNVVRSFGGSPAGLVGGFMVAAALLSMWISNSATSIMMMPIALSVAVAVGSEEDGADKNFTYAVVLGIAYACSIGGLGTPIGTPTNLIVLGYLNEQGEAEIGFSQWMMIGIPIVLIMVPLAWYSLTRWSFKLPELDSNSAKAKVSERLMALGPTSVPEKRTLIVFIVIAFLWIFRRTLEKVEITVNGDVFAPLTGLTDHMIAIIGVLLCFVIPAGSNEHEGKKLLNWNIAEQIPWGVLLLFGGGMSLAQAISFTGLSAYIGESLSVIGSFPIPVLILLISAAVLALTEVTSNIATASALMPVLGSMALETGLPLEIMAAPVALAASCAFMLPMATGPNAVAFATGRVELATMARVGVRVNLLALLAITLVAYFLAPIALG